MDDDALYPPNDCASLKVRLTYRFSAEGTPDLIAITDVRLFGDGTHEISSRWLQSETLALAHGAEARARGQWTRPESPEWRLNWCETRL